MAPIKECIVLSWDTATCITIAFIIMKNIWLYLLPGPIWYQSRFFSHRSRQHLGIIEFYYVQRLQGQKAYKGVEKAKGVKRQKQKKQKKGEEGEHSVCFPKSFRIDQSSSNSKLETLKLVDF